MVMVNPKKNICGRSCCRLRTSAFLCHNRLCGFSRAYRFDGVVFWLTYANLDPAILENALAENPAINDLSDDELVALDEVMENLPSLLPILWVYLGLQSFAYLYYGIGVVRTSSPN